MTQFNSAPDRLLSDQIQDALHHSQGLFGSEIDVTSNGNDVVLSGTVQISLQKRLAAAIAQRFCCSSVRNEIVVSRNGLVL